MRGQNRAIESLRIRRDAAEDEYERLFADPGACPDPAPEADLPDHPCNGDDFLYSASNFIGSFTKGLPHDSTTSEVNSTEYCKLLTALDTDDGFEDLTLGCDPCDPSTPDPKARRPQRKLENPQAAYAFDLQGADSHSLVMPPPPAFYSEEEAAEMLELYWMALARDIPFVDYPPYADPPPLFTTAFDDLARYHYFEDPDWEFGVPLTLDTLFRGFTEGDRKGPYLSQFFLYDVAYGSQVIPARIRTLMPGVDYMTDWKTFIDVQNGCDEDQTACDPTPRFIRSGRDLAQFVHLDNDFYVWYNACNVLVNSADPLRRCEAAAGLGAEFDDDLPYNNPSAATIQQFPSPPKSKTQIGVGTFGPQHVKSLVLEAVNRAVKAVWYQKWLIHRRVRPEEYGGFVHLEATKPGTYPVPHSLYQSPLFNPPGSAGPFDIFEHNALQNANKRNPPEPGPDGGTYLLPMAYAEGSPLHPSYGQGHATIAGACATILKAFFDEGQKIVNPMVPNRDGTALEPYTGPDKDDLTLGGELNKLASNVGLGRDFAGVHWRSDYAKSLKLGEKVAISLLFDQIDTFHEDALFEFTLFEGGGPIQISKSTTVAQVQALLAAS